MMKRTTAAARSLGIVLLLAASLAAGCGALSTSREGGSSSGVAVAPSDTQNAVKSGTDELGVSYGSEESVDSAQAPVSADRDTLVISTAGMNVEVKDLDASVAAIRGIATKYGASIANLATNAGTDPVVVPEPLDGTSAQYTAPTPGGATITLRIPSDSLPAAEKDIAALGRVISQSSSQDDVTQQHVDMEARLKNLQAEEARLRTFFLKAKRVSEMLAIEQELSRVRGEIESMQAQIDYLERQAALATLTVSLSQPGALVSPASGGWGFAAAIREGVRAAATVTRALITILLALSPIILIGLVLVAVIRTLVRSRRRRRAAAERAASPTDGEADGVENPSSQDAR